MSNLDNLNVQNNLVKSYLTIFIIIMIVISWFGFLDFMANNYINSALVQSSAGFVIARTVNGLVSFLQTITVGVGITFNPAAILEPLRDLIEQYSSITKTAIGSLLTQKLLVEIVSDTLFKALLTVSGILLIVSIYAKKAKYATLFLKPFIFLLFIRFLLVMVFLLSAAADKIFLNEKIESELNKTEIVINALKEENSLEKKDAKKIVKQENQKFEKEKNALIDENLQLSNKKIALQKDLEVQIDKIEKRGVIDRYNPLNDDKELFTQKEKVEKLENQIATLEDKINQNKVKTDNLNEKIQYNQNVLEDKANGVIDYVSNQAKSFGESVSGFVDQSSIANIKEKTEELFDNIFNLAIIFIFKTMLLPLLFLFLLIKGTNKIWDIDLKKMINKDKEYFITKENN